MENSIQQPAHTVRKNHPPAFKARVGIEAIKGEKTIAEIASIYSIHTSQVKRWKQIAISGIEAMFSGSLEKLDKEQKALIQCLYQQIGQLSVECDWLKKKMGMLEK